MLKHRIDYSESSEHNGNNSCTIIILSKRTDTVVTQ